MTRGKGATRDVTALAGLLAGLAITTPVTGQVSVSEQAIDVGLIAIHSPAVDGIPASQERMTGGLGVGDFNNDGHQDIFWVGGGLIPDKLFMNNGVGIFTDEAEAWGLTELHCGNAVSVADYDGNGWLDIYVSSFGPPEIPEGEPGHNRLYRNNGDGTFTNVATDAGVNYTSPTVSNGFGSAWGDYDLDGDLDLFVTTWKTLGGNPIQSDGNRLYRNNGDSTFTDVTDTAVGATNLMRGFQPAFVDMNGDLYPELLIAADYHTSHYYVNNGDGTFTDQTGPSGTGLDEWGMGQAVGDFNNDGLFDWYVTSIYPNNPAKGIDPGNMLYMNQGDHLYVEIAETAGVSDGGWGWGAVAVDLDQDGLEDIVEVNGWTNGGGAGQYFGERAKLFYNTGTDIDDNPVFNEIALAAGLDNIDLALYIGYLDTDGDGDLDLLITNRESALQYYENITDPIGNWLRITLDTSTNPLLAPNGFGTKITATVGGQSYYRYMSASPSYLGTSELVIHFGLGGAVTVDELRIEWARGQVTTLLGEATNQAMTISAPILGDFDGSGSITTADLLALLSAWGPVTGPEGLAADLNNDGVVATADLLFLLGGWG